MPNTIEQVIAYARSHPTRDGGTWHNWCESFVWRAGGFGVFFGSATLAGDASGYLNPRAAAAPRGAIHFWGGGPGHVGFELGGGLVLMASNGVTHLWGTALGTATIAEYARNKPNMIYRGWTLRHGIEKLAPTPKPAPAVAEVIIKPLPPKEEDPMAHPISFVKGDSTADGYVDAVFRIDNRNLTRRYLPYNGVLLGLPGGIGEVKTISQGALDLIPWDNAAAAAEWYVVEAKIKARK